MSPTFRNAYSASCSWYAGFTDTCRVVKTMKRSLKQIHNNYSFSLWNVTILKNAHQYNTSFGCGKLEHDPFISVGSPHAEPVSPRQSECQKPSWSFIHLHTSQRQRRFIRFALNGGEEDSVSNFKNTRREVLTSVSLNANPPVGWFSG